MTAISLKLRPAGTCDKVRPRVVQEYFPPGLPRVHLIDRESHGLHASPFVDQGDVLSLNLTQGCVQRCPFCSVRAHPSYAGNEAIYLYQDTAERLDEELRGRRKLPRAVFISPSTDPFPPLAAVQAETMRVVAVLAKHEIEAWLMTRGFIRPSAMKVLASHRKWVKITVALTTLERDLQRHLEPLCASPRMRLRQIAGLRGLGIPLQIALEPLVPGLTDTREILAPLLEGLAKAGVRHVRTSYLFLRPAIHQNLMQALEPLGIAQLVLDAYSRGPILSAGTIAPARCLPKWTRQRGYATLMALAAEHGITVSVCDTTNPDFRAPRPASPQAASGIPLFSQLA